MEWFEAASLALSVLHDTVGGAHPLAGTIRHALEKSDYLHAAAGARAVAKLYETSGLGSARLAIAHELEGDILQIAQQQMRRAEISRATGIAIISASENKQMTAWGATRNSADHGKLSELTRSEVLSMVIGVRGFLDKRMP